MKKILLLATMSLLAVACGKDDKNPFSNAKEAIEDKDLQGKNFESDCRAEAMETAQTGLANGVEQGVEATKNEGIIKGIQQGVKAAVVNSVKSSRLAYRFQGSNISRTNVKFANDNCDGEAYRVTETGTFNVVKNQKNNDGGKFIDIEYKRVLVTPASVEGAATLNNIKLCGLEKWENGKEVEVTAQAQNKDVNCSKEIVPRKNLNAYRLDAAKVLYMGSDTSENGAPRPATSTNVKFTSNK